MKKGQRDPKGALLLLGLVFLALFPLFAARSEIYRMAGMLISVLYACSFYIVLGKAGILSFGHGAFFGIGGSGTESHSIRWATVGWTGCCS